MSGTLTLCVLRATVAPSMALLGRFLQPAVTLRVAGSGSAASDAEVSTTPAAADSTGGRSPVWPEGTAQWDVCLAAAPGIVTLHVGLADAAGGVGALGEGTVTLDLATLLSTARADGTGTHSVSLCKPGGGRGCPGTVALGVWFEAAGADAAAVVPGVAPRAPLVRKSSGRALVTLQRFPVGG
jgi:hypothetical protein